MHKFQHFIVGNEYVIWHTVYYDLWPACFIQHYQRHRMKRTKTSESFRFLRNGYIRSKVNNFIPPKKASVPQISTQCCNNNWYR